MRGADAGRRRPRAPHIGNANGGSSTSGNAGSGGDTSVWSQENGSAVSGTLSARKGTGSGSPTDGTVNIDGMVVNP